MLVVARLHKQQGALLPAADTLAVYVAAADLVCGRVAAAEWLVLAVAVAERVAVACRVIDADGMREGLAEREPATLPLRDGTRDLDGEAVSRTVREAARLMLDVESGEADGVVVLAGVRVALSDCALVVGVAAAVIRREAVIRRDAELLADAAVERVALAACMLFEGAAVAEADGRFDGHCVTDGEQLADAADERVKAADCEGVRENERAALADGEPVRARLCDTLAESVALDDAGLA